MSPNGDLSPECPEFLWLRNQLAIVGGASPWSRARSINAAAERPSPAWLATPIRTAGSALAGPGWSKRIKRRATTWAPGGGVRRRRTPTSP